VTLTFVVDFVALPTAAGQTPAALGATNIPGARLERVVPALCSAAGAAGAGACAAVAAVAADHAAAGRAAAGEAGVGDVKTLDDRDHRRDQEAQSTLDAAPESLPEATSATLLAGGEVLRCVQVQAMRAMRAIRAV